MDKVKYRIALVDKDNSAKSFWAHDKYSPDVKTAWTGTQKQAETEYKGAKKFAEEKYGCPCPHDIIIEDVEGKQWYIPGGVNMDA